MCSSEQGFHWNRMRQDYSCLLTADSAPPSSSILLIPDNLFSLIWFTHWFCVTFPPPLLATPSGIFSGRDRNLVASLVGQTVKNLPAVQEPWVRSLGWEDPLEEGMVTHSSMVAWRAWTEDSGGLQSMGLKRVGHNQATKHSTDMETRERVTGFLFLGSKITADGDCSHEIKRHLLPGRKAMTNIDSVLKSRDITLPTKVHLVKHYFADKGPYSQSCGFSSSHVRMWELDYKKSWVLKNWCFLTVMLENTLESSLNCKEIKLVNPKRNQSWIFIGSENTHWSWSSNDLATWCEELTHWKRPWCWERLKAGGEGDDRGWDGWIESLAWWTWIWASSRSWWTGRPDVLQSLGLQSQTWMNNWTDWRDAVYVIINVKGHSLRLSTNKHILQKAGAIVLPQGPYCESQRLQSSCLELCLTALLCCQSSPREPWSLTQDYLFLWRSGQQRGDDRQRMEPCVKTANSGWGLEET